MAGAKVCLLDEYCRHECRRLSKGKPPRNLRYAFDGCVSGQIGKQDEVGMDIFEIVCIIFYV